VDKALIEHLAWQKNNNSKKTDPENDLKEVNCLVFWARPSDEVKKILDGIQQRLSDFAGDGMSFFTSSRSPPRIQVSMCPDSKMLIYIGRLLPSSGKPPPSSGARTVQSAYSPAITSNLRHIVQGNVANNDQYSLIATKRV
jgi:hypothetical protein